MMTKVHTVSIVPKITLDKQAAGHRCLRKGLLLQAAKEVSVQTIQIPHEQRRKRLEVASSKLGNFTFHAHARLPCHERVAYPIGTTNEP
jgi:hypothetical protein